eukprot:542789-Hanusia_phi.AAC.5
MMICGPETAEKSGLNTSAAVKSVSSLTKGKEFDVNEVRHLELKLPYDTKLEMSRSSCQEIGLVARSAFYACFDLTEAEEAERLAYFASKAGRSSASCGIVTVKCLQEGMEDRIEYCEKAKRSVLNVFEDFPSLCKAGNASRFAVGHMSASSDFSQFLAILPRLQPRAYSIASSPLAHNWPVKSYISVLLSLSIDRLSDGAQLDYLPVAIIPDFGSGLAFSFNKPAIVVGAGSGIAPFRGILWERKMMKFKNLLVAGEEIFCMKTNGNIFFVVIVRASSSLRALVWSSIKYFKIFCRFSRDGKEKEYVQHKIAMFADDIWEALTLYFTCCCFELNWI